ncbi:MAG: hypothetical protein ACYS8W_05395 [Planctomycetota bacterium]|jgi:hypothetical protein
MKKLADFYINKALLIGFLYAAFHSVAYFIVVVLVAESFRNVYLLRLAISLVVGGVAGAYINRHGLEMWLSKHRSGTGPATVLDGLFNGAAVGFGVAVIPALTALIASHHLDEAKTAIIITYLASTVIGGIIGAALAAVGRKYVPAKSGSGE